MLISGLGLSKRFEHGLETLWRYATPRVLDADVNPRSLAGERRSAHGLAGASADGNPAAPRRELDGVAEQIDQDLPDASLVTPIREIRRRAGYRVQHRKPAG